jgi:hypothetical protein
MKHVGPPYRCDGEGTVWFPMRITATGPAEVSSTEHVALTISPPQFVMARMVAASAARQPHPVLILSAAQPVTGAQRGHPVRCAGHRWRHRSGGRDQPGTGVRWSYCFAGRGRRARYRELAQRAPGPDRPAGHRDPGHRAHRGAHPGRRAGRPADGRLGAGAHRDPGTRRIRPGDAARPDHGGHGPGEDAAPGRPDKDHPGERLGWDLRRGRGAAASTWTTSSCMRIWSRRSAASQTLPARHPGDTRATP